MINDGLENPVHGVLPVIPLEEGFLLQCNDHETLVNKAKENRTMVQLIDGYNLLHMLGWIDSRHGQAALEQARERLVRFLILLSSWY